MKTLQVIGPFYTNYSLARVNRGLALALSKIQNEYKVTIHGDKDTIDWYPTESDLEKKPKLKEIFNPEREITDIAVYNNFPKITGSLHGLKDLPGKVKLAYFAWEESVYPKEWVDEINANLHGLMVASNFTKSIFQKAGIKIPMKVVPNALDDEVRIKAKDKYKLNTNKSFKFLHISTAKQRKGVDILIKAYFEEFTKDDDVTLVLKTFPGPDNITDELINKYKNENSPEVIHINNPDLTEEDLRNLHASADCEVYPTRAEGFGLPILEAMFQETPVITTNYSGHLDFCNEENSYLIDYKLEYAKDSELVNIGAKWAEPDIEHLKKLMREIYLGGTGNTTLKEIIEKKVKNAKKTAEKYTWENTAKVALEFIKEIESISYLKDKTIAVISPINDETGIADYAKDLYTHIESSFKEFYYLANKDIADRSEPDEENVLRTWESGEESFAETLKFIEDSSIDIVHIQYHSGNFFSPEALGDLIKNVKNLGAKVFLTFHSFRSKNFNYLESVPNLKIVDKIFIHNVNDYEYASSKLKIVKLFILPTVEFKKRDKKRLRDALGLQRDDIIIASHGLMNTNKNIPEIIEAVNEVKKEFKNVKFFSINAVSSNNIHSSGIYNQCLELVRNLGLENDVRFFTDFLSDEYIEILLQTSDIIVFNYTEVGESASASVRKALASGNPTIVTNINMFSEFRNEVLKIKDNFKESVASAIISLLKDSEMRTSIISNAHKFVKANLYEKKALETLMEY